MHEAFRPIGSLLVIALVSLGSAGANAQEVPYVGVVTEDKVSLHAGGGENYYKVGEMTRGDLVKVEEVSSGWMRVHPPNGVHSYVHKMYVDLDDRGESGRVTQDRAPAYAGSVHGPAESYRTQVYLAKDDELEIVEREGAYLKVIPPNNAFVWAPPNSIGRATPQQVAQFERQQKGGAEEAAETTTGTTATDTTRVVAGGTDDGGATEATPTEAATESSGTTTATETVEATETTEATEEPATPDETTETATTETTTTATTTATESTPEPAPVSQQLVDVEKRFFEAIKKPLEEQPLEELVRAYESIRDDKGSSSYEQRIAQTRIDHLQRNQQLARTIRQIEAARVEVTLPSAKRDEEKSDRPEPMDAERYDAIGRLLASNIYDGDQLPLLYRLVEPKTLRTIAYVRPSNKLDISSTLGQLVGVVGEARYDEALKLRVIDPEDVDGMTASAQN